MAMKSAASVALRGLRSFSSRSSISAPINKDPNADLLVSGKSFFSVLRLSLCLLSSSFDFEFKDFILVGMFVYCEAYCDLIATFLFSGSQNVNIHFWFLLLSSFVMSEVLNFWCNSELRKGFID